MCPQSSRLARRVAGLTCWGILGIGASSFIARTFETRDHRTAMLAAIMPMARFAVGGAGAAAVALRRPALSAVALGLSLLLTSTQAPLFDGRDRAHADDGVAIRLMTSNVLASNPDLGGLVEDLASRDPDVILLQEITPEHATTLRALPLDGRYPHRVYNPLPFVHGYALLSRFPVASSTVDGVDGWPLIRTVVETPAGEVEIVNVHTPAPTNRFRHSIWEQELDDMRSWLLASTRPILLAGDFNATPDHQDFRALLAGEPDDAWNRAGSGWGTTYRDGPVIAATIQLDHVVVTDDWGVSDIEVIGLAGSDHRGLLADLVLLDGPAGDQN